MEDNFEFFDNNDEEAESVSRFEEMLRNDSFYYFDPSELEDIIDHYFFTDDKDKAERSIELGLSLHPDSSALLLRLAQLRYERGQLKESLDAANRAESYDPSNDDVLLLKAQIFSNIEDRAMSIQYLYKAYTVCESEERSQILIEIAGEYVASGDYNEAIRTLRKLLEEYPNKKEALYELAFCYELAGDLKSSINLYEQYLNFDPYSYLTWYNMGNTYCKLDKFEEAVKAFDYAVVIKEDLGSGHFNKANALLQLNRYEEAIEAFEDSMEIEGKQALTLNYLGETYEKMERYQDALDNYNLAIQIDPELPDPWLGIGIVKDLMGDPHDSIPYLEKAVNLDDSNFSNWIVLGNAYEKIDKTTEAESCYRTAIELDPTSPEAYVDLTNLLFENARTREAIELGLNALKTCRELTDVLEYRLIAYLFADGRNKEALYKLEHALKSNFIGHKEILEYYPEIMDKSDAMHLIEIYSK